MKRNKIPAVATIICLALAICSLGLWQTGHPVLKEVVVQDNYLYHHWGPLRICHISDIHLPISSGLMQRTLELIKKTAPDLICITGDIAQWSGKDAHVVAFLQGLETIAPVYAVFGDADMAQGRKRCFWCHKQNDIHFLKETGVKILRDDTVTVHLPRSRIRIVGLSPEELDHENQKFLVADEKRGQKRDEPLLVLSHFSKNWTLLPESLHLLWLSGDTHGGQVYMPKPLWPLFRGKDYNHLRGLFKQGNRWLYVTSGIGTTAKLPLRIGITPEVTLIRISQED